jgi:hypothetical protein
MSHDPCWVSLHSSDDLRLSIHLLQEHLHREGPQALPKVLTKARLHPRRSHRRKTVIWRETDQCSEGGIGVDLIAERELRQRKSCVGFC